MSALPHLDTRTPPARPPSLHQRVHQAVLATEPPLLIALGVGVGLLAGLGAVVVDRLIVVFHSLFFTGGGHLLGFLGPYQTVLLPAAGGLLTGLIIHFGSSEAQGHGVPEILEALSVRAGMIKGRVAVVKSLASAINIGSGGSVGPEGPIAQIGAALGSGVGQLLRLTRSEKSTLLACGAAGGIAAVFNAPLAGAFFGLEIVLAAYRAEFFAPVVGAAVSACVTRYYFLGNAPTFQVPEYSVNALNHLPWFLLLGALAAVTGVGFVRLLYMVEDNFGKLRLPAWVKPALGGLVVGVIGLYDPQLYGIGGTAISNALQIFHYTLGALLALLVLKALATSFTLGSGGSGGVFVPTLFLGAMLGAGVGQGLHLLFPAMAISPGAFALVGMGAVFAATSHAPITAVFVVFEITHDYRMILPLMLACGVSVILAKMIFRFSVYNFNLVRRGIHVSLREDTRLLEDVTVGEAMTCDLVTVRPEETVRQVQVMFERTNHHGFPLVDAAGRLHGIVTLGDLRDAPEEALDGPVSALASHDLVVAYPDETLNEALVKLGLREIGRLPVVERHDVTHLVGLITRKNLIGAYDRALAAVHTELEGTVQEQHYS